MGWAITEKDIKVHICIDGADSVEDYRVLISHKKLKTLGAKRRTYKNTKEVFYLVESNCEITF